MYNTAMDPETQRRLERAERMLTSLVQVAKSHEQRLSKLAEIASSLAESAAEHEPAIKELRAAQKKTDEQLRRTDEQQARNEEELSALIRIMDEWIRRNPRRD